MVAMGKVKVEWSVGDGPHSARAVLVAAEPQILRTSGLFQMYEDGSGRLVFRVRPGEIGNHQSAGDYVHAAYEGWSAAKMVLRINGDEYLTKRQR